MPEQITREALTYGSGHWLVDAEAGNRWLSAGPSFALGMLGEAKPAPLYTLDGADAIVPVRGVLTRYGDAFSNLFGTSTYEAIAEAVAKADLDPEVERIVLDIDSPGGSVAGLGLVTEKLGKATKPMVARAAGLCASAALYLALAADEVEADPMSVIGSIGAMTTVYQSCDDGESKRFVSAVSPNKQLDPTSPEGERETQAIIDDMGAHFVSWVAERRSVPVAEVPTRFGGGRVMSARAALEAGLIDRIVGPQSDANVTQGIPNTKTETNTADPPQEMAMDPENMSPEDIQALLDELATLKEELARLREEQADDEAESEAEADDPAEGEKAEGEAMDDDKKALAEALARIDAMEREQAVASALREGRLTPAEKAAAQAVWAQGGSQLFATVYGARAKNSVIPKVTGRGGKSTTGVSLDDQRHAVIEAKMASDKLPYHEAARALIAERHNLFVKETHR